MDDFELMVAPTGARRGKAHHKALPIRLDEIVEAAQTCAEAGATALHLHVRDAQGRHTLDPELYNRTIKEISGVTDLHVQVSTEAADLFGAEDQVACLSRVEARDASLALREMKHRPDAYALAEARGIDIQHILYTPNEVTALLGRFDEGTIPRGRARVIFVLGRYSRDMESQTSDLRPFLNAMGNAPLDWMVCAFGPQEQACLLAALDEGGNVRVGFENNHIAPDGVPFANNAEAVACLVAAAHTRGFTPKRDAA